MEQPESPGTVYSIRAVQRVCNILDLIQENPGGFTLTQVADVTQFPKSSAYRYLATLESRRYVIRDPLNGMYRIGPAFLPLQDRQLTVLADRIRPYLNRLHEQYKETLNLAILDGYRVSYLEIIESPHSVRLAPRLGDRDHLHCTALGKAVATLIDADHVKMILGTEGMPQRTEKSITTIDEFLVELEKCRTQGFAGDDRENDVDGRCVAVPLTGVGYPAAVSIAAPASRMKSEEIPAFGKALLETVQAFSNEMAE